MGDTVVFNSEFQPLVAVAFAGDHAAALVAVLHADDDGTVLVGEPVDPYNVMGVDHEVFGGLFTYWVMPDDLSKWSDPVQGPIAAPLRYKMTYQVPDFDHPSVPHATHTVTVDAVDYEHAKVIIRLSEPDAEFIGGYATSE